MTDFFTFPSINQFRNAIRNVAQRVQYRGKDETDEPLFDLTKPLPTIRYRGTVKLHGTNAAVVYDCEDDTFRFQSRERILTLENDNCRFMLSMLATLETLRTIINNYKQDAQPNSIVLFGEWCGQGVQGGVAISQLPKMFVIFAVKFYYDDRSEWVDLNRAYVSEADRIFCIEQFPYFDLDIDFQRPELAQDAMIAITQEVEMECPIGAYFGVSGTGEGVVWRPYDQNWPARSVFWFKVKGEKHSVTRVRTLAPVDVEAVATVREFVECTVTEQRLVQGIHWLQTEARKPLEMTSMGDFLRWVANDVLKEEQDTIIASQIDPKKLTRQLSDKARPWFTQYINSISPTDMQGPDAEIILVERE